MEAEDDDLFFVDKAGEVFGGGEGAETLGKQDRRKMISKEEARLTKALFGSVSLEGLQPLVGDASGFEIGALDQSGENTSQKRDRGAAWVDSDEEEQEQEEFAVDHSKRGRPETALREEYEKQMPAWAQREQKKESSAAVFLSTASVTGKSASAVLEPGLLKVQQLSNLNSESRSDAPVNSFEFSTQSLLALTAGTDKTLRLFQVGEKKCSKIHSLFFPDLPIKKACFVPRSNEILCLGIRRKFYLYDMEGDATTRIPYLNLQQEERWADVVCSPDGQKAAFCGGSSGNVVLYSTRSQQVAHVLKQGMSATHASWSEPDGNRLWTSGPDGFVFEWDVRNTRNCLARFRDQGSIGTCSMRTSPDGQWQAIGDKSGMVNIYNVSQHAQDLNSPTPVKSLGNLVTAVSMLSWSGDSQMLAMGSSKMPHAFRVAHVPSFTVFKNWPLESAGINVCSSVSFSPNSGYLGIGNRTGEALLYRMLSYPTY